MREVIRIVYWEDSGSRSPLDLLTERSRELWARLRRSVRAFSRDPAEARTRGRTPGSPPSRRRGTPGRRPAGGRGTADGDRSSLRMVRLEDRPTDVRHVCPEEPAIGSRSNAGRGTTAHVAYRDGQWWARHPDGRIEIAYCPFCGRELPGHVPDPEQLHLELVD